ncbi:MAG: NAD(P)/FAD-dependent oxidoreductase [Acidimicrobiales bacterium]|nr:NAD(P)/FAD-dependent oxidoreductase [Acidimicrobiales bacterium]
MSGALAGEVADIAVVGSGPNGLAAAVMLARAGLGVTVYEGADVPGGGCRTSEVTLPGFRHDVCSAVHPLLSVSRFFRSVDLDRRGVRLLHSPVVLAHPLDGGRAAVLRRSLDDTAAGLGIDARKYRRLLSPLVGDCEGILSSVLAPLRSAPRSPVGMARFGLIGLFPASDLVRQFRTDEARALFGGAAAHSMRPLRSPLTGSFALLFTMLGHATGWPIVEGGSARIADALIAELTDYGVEVVTERWVRDLGDIRAGRATLLDVSTTQLVSMAANRLGPRARRGFRRFRYGPGVCKVDWALSGPVPWTAPACREAGTVHVCGTFEEVALSELEVSAGLHPERPFCIVAQPGVVDSSRAPDGRHTLWAYCHVPPGSTLDMTDRIETQIERFAPGFRDLVMARTATTAWESEMHNPNHFGGDIGGGVATLRQTVFRPRVSWNPYRTGIDGVYLCSAATPPGAGVHGLCGYWAARTVLKDLRIPAASESWQRVQETG